MIERRALTFWRPQKDGHVRAQKESDRVKALMRKGPQSELLVGTIPSLGLSVLQTRPRFEECLTFYSLLHPATVFVDGCGWARGLYGGECDTIELID